MQSKHLDGPKESESEFVLLRVLLTEFLPDVASQQCWGWISMLTFVSTIKYFRQKGSDEEFEPDKWTRLSLCRAFFSSDHKAFTCFSCIDLSSHILRQTTTVHPTSMQT